MNLLQVSICAPVLIQHTEPTYIPGILFWEQNPVYS